MIINCPHCFTRIVPTQEGECPSCRKIISEADVDPDRTSVSVEHLAVLPPNCFACGRHTDRYYKVVEKFSRQADGDGEGTTLVLLAISLLTNCAALPLALLFGLRQRTKDTIIVEVPQCELCGAEGRPTPISINPNTLRLTFLVHRDFQRALQEARSGS